MLILSPPSGAPVSALVRLALGEPKAFVVRLLALSSLVALVTGSLALRDLIAASAPAGTGGAALFVGYFLAEADALLAAWLVPVWLVIAAASFMVTLDSARSFTQTAGLIRDLGGSDRLGTVLLARGVLLAPLSLAVGVSLGVVASQVVFRAAVVLLGAPFYVPELSPGSLGLAALLALTALLLGSGSSLAVSRPGGSR